MIREHSTSMAALAGLLCAVASALGASAGFAPHQLEFFEQKVRPLLTERCYKCHSTGSEKLKGGLLLDSRQMALKGGDTRAAIVPGEPEKSLLIEAVRYGNPDLQMPPKSKLTDTEIADLTAWVKQGAPWPTESAPQKTVTKSFDLDQRKREHWSWEPLKDRPLPAVKDSAWGKNPIDRFVLARLEGKSLRPAAPADKRTLIRRACFDLIGLPPAPADVERFVKDSSPDAFAKVVDHLLASPAFGERWARHWLDLVRYAETRGHEYDPIIPNAYQYRDYVIRALNLDVPYKQFVIEHIAGDLVSAPRLNPATAANESILGTGFWFLGEEVHSPVDIRQDEADRLDNRLDVMTKTFLGLTVACARCHDHKFDAISQRDYYALTGFLISSTYRQARFETIEAHRQIAGQLEHLRTAERAKILKAIAQAQRPGIHRTAELLLAAREALQSANDTKGESIADANGPGGKNGGDEVVKPDSVDRQLIARWAVELRKARGNPDHPLHAFATVTLQMQGDDSAEFVSHLSPILTTWQKQKMEAASAVVPTRIVVDYARPGPKDWVQDGWSFGTRPARVGDAIFGLSAEQPVSGFVARAAAVRDLTWSKLAVRHAERDDTKLGPWERSEQTLRTPDVTLSAGSLWYLVRGAVRAYAAVDSHVTIHGPLHGALVKEFKDDRGKWRWLEHKLTDYQGHRVHVEFSPVGAEPLAIALIVQSDTQPALPDAPNELVLEALGNADVTSPQAMADALQKLFVRVAEQMAADKPSAAAEAGDAAELADWLVQNNDLFCPPGGAQRQQLAAATRSFIAAQAQLSARIRPDSQTAPAMLDGSGVDEFLLIRGQTKIPGERTPRRFLEALAGTHPPDYATGSGRLELAQQMIDLANPFTSRVIVNRVWYHLLGRGIVPTVDNFGVLGQPPSHRELLDYLAVHFIRDQGWSVKKLIREIVLSHTYQMSSAPADERAELADPENRLLHRMNLKRLEGEAIRDAVLAVSGRLDPKVGGPSVPVHLTPFMDGRGKPKVSGPLDGDGRRSIYISVRRNFLQPMLLAFDAPIPFTSMGQRNVSNVPAQALILMNDPFVVEQTHVWAKKLAPIADPNERVRQMYLTAFSRPPGDAELRDALAFVSDQAKSYDAAPDDERVWADLGHVLFNVKEFIYVN